MVALVFAMMYYKVEIGYLYSITYYYSIVDILLSQNLQVTRGLYLTVSIIKPGARRPKIDIVRTSVCVCMCVCVSVCVCVCPPPGLLKTIHVK